MEINFDYFIIIVVAICKLLLFTAESQQIPLHIPYCFVCFEMCCFYCVNLSMCIVFECIVSFSS